MRVPTKKPQNSAVKLLAATVAAALLAVGCAGTPFRWEAARQIRPGMTEQQVVAIMGDPLSVAVTPNGNAWVWTYADGFGHARTLSVLFKDGKVATAPAVPTALR
jgi:outer membrane protein assembly factor BamE (lipoprotein component of BamABCDE complex)